MRKLISALILVLTLVVIAASAFLPQIVAAVQDGAMMNKTQYGSLQSVRLEIREELPALAKIALVSDMSNCIAIDPEDAAMNEAEAHAAANTALEPYLSAGLMEPYKESYSEWRPLLIQSPTIPELNGIVWEGMIVGDTDVYYVIQVWIDDATGDLLRIDFCSNYLIEKDLREDYLNTFCDIYFTNLGITYYEQYRTDDLISEYLDQGTRAVCYRFGDIVYGEINVELFVNQYGFHLWDV